MREITSCQDDTTFTVTIVAAATGKHEIPLPLSLESLTDSSVVRDVEAFVTSL